MEKRLYNWATILMMAFACVMMTACGEDDNGDSDDSAATILSRLTGQWTNGSMILTFKSDYTGGVSDSKNEDKFPNGFFTFSRPTNVVTEDGSTWFLITASYHPSGKRVEWEIAYDVKGKRDVLVIEGLEYRSLK